MKIFTQNIKVRKFKFVNETHLNVFGVFYYIFLIIFSGIHLTLYFHLIFNVSYQSVTWINHACNSDSDFIAKLAPGLNL